MNYYVHVPFCRSKCGYCAFYSVPGCDAERFDAYLDHLARQLAFEPEGECDTIYVGGGTPTLLDLPRLERLITLLKQAFRPTADTEISIEANPETLDAEKVALLRTFFTRISVGVQSFDEVLRRRIGRRCSQEALETALSLVADAKFPHWNCDLIYALPDQSVAAWREELRRCAALGCDHLSCYALTPEEESRLGRSFTADDEREREMYEAAAEELAAFGIHRYEISNYAKTGCACRHNVSVWRGGLLRAFGPSAAGFDGNVRTIGQPSLDAWLADAPAERDELPHPARLNEIFAVNLRTVAGWTPELWKSVPGADSWQKRLDLARKAEKICPGCLSIEEKRIILTADGLLFWNEVAQELL